MSDEIDFEFDTATFDELRETLEKVAKKYPDYAEKELKKEGREFSKAVRKEALSANVPGSRGPLGPGAGSDSPLSRGCARCPF